MAQEADVVAGAQFFGLGGGVPPTPFPWSFDLSEDEAAANIHQCWGREATIGTTPVVNVGPDGRAFDI